MQQVGNYIGQVFIFMKTWSRIQGKKQTCNEKTDVWPHDYHTGDDRRQCFETKQDFLQENVLADLDINVVSNLAQLHQ